MQRDLKIPVFEIQHGENVAALHLAREVAHLRHQALGLENSKVEGMKIPAGVPGASFILTRRRGEDQRPEDWQTMPAASQVAKICFAGASFCRVQPPEAGGDRRSLVLREVLHIVGTG